MNNFLNRRVLLTGKYPMLRTNTKPHQPIKHAKISSSIVSLVFRKFSYQTYRNSLNQVLQSWGTWSISKSTKRVTSIPFVRNPYFNILLHRMRYLKNLFMFRRTGYHFRKSINSRSLLFAKDMIFAKQKFDVKQLED